MIRELKARGHAQSKPHIAYFVNQYPLGSHSFIRREIEEIEKQGFTVSRFSGRGWDAELVDEHDLEELKHTRFLLKGGLLRLLGATLLAAVKNPMAFFRALSAAVRMSKNASRPLPYHLVYLAQACRLKAWCYGTSISHLHAHFGTNSAEIAMLQYLLGGPPFSFTVHGPDEIDHAPGLHLDIKTMHARFVIAISSYTRGQLFRYLRPQDFDKVKVVHCGLPEQYFREEATAIPDTPRLLCIGRYNPQKGHWVLLEAFAKVVEQIPDAKLVLAGDGELRPMIESRIQALQLQNNVTLTGWLSDAEVRDQIRQSQLVVQPSFQEGLPVVLMEALALGRPVLSTYIAGIPELVIPDQAGWLVPCGNVELLTAAIVRVLGLPKDERAAVTAEGRRRVLERHNVVHEVSKLLTHIHNSCRSVEPLS